MSNIHLEDRHMAIIKEILQGHEGAYAFGSRVKGTHKKFSDLDICFIRDKALELSEIGGIRREFEDSNLPFKVDIVDYHQVKPDFQAIIDRDKVELL